MKVLKGGIRKNNQVPYKVFRFRLFDKVLYENKEYFIWGRRQSGSFCLKTLAGEKLDGINYKKLEYIENKKGVLTEVKF